MLNLCLKRPPYQVGGRLVPSTFEGFQTSELPLNLLEPFKKGIDSATDSIQFALVAPLVRAGLVVYKYKKNHSNKLWENIEFYWFAFVSSLVLY